MPARPLIAAGVLTAVSATAVAALVGTGAVANAVAFAPASPASSAVAVRGDVAAGAVTPATVHAISRVDAGVAVGQLKAAGLTVQGRGYEAWSWKDGNGSNLLVTTRQVDQKQAGVPYNGVLRAYTVTGVGSRTQRPALAVVDTNDQGTEGDGSACDLDGGIDFVEGSTRVTDSDRDGAAEVSVGWWQMCRSDVGAANVHLATITEQGIHTLSGEGSPRQPRSAEDEAGIFPPAGTADVPAVTPVANPAPAAWPAGAHGAATALFQSLFR